MAGSTEFSVNIVIRSTDKSSQSTNKAAKSLQTLQKAAKFAVGAFAALKAAQAGVDFVKTGAAVDRQKKSLDALAKSAGTSGKAIVSAMQSASDNTIDSMSAMQAANKAMLLDVAKSPEQFARLTKTATQLGRVMGQDATKSIDDFVTAAGRQSKQIADNLGLMVGAEDANIKYAKSLGTTADKLTDAQKKQAFLNEMLVQGEKKLEALGDQGLDTAAKIEQLEAAAADTKTSIAEMIAVSLDGSGALDWVVDSVKMFPETVKKANMLGIALLDASRAAQVLKNPMEAFNQSLRLQVGLMEKGNPEIDRYANTLNEINPEVGKFASAHEKAVKPIGDVQSEIVQLDTSTLALVKSDGDLLHTILSTQKAIDKQATATKSLTADQIALNQQTKELVLDQGVAWTQHFANVEKQQEDSKATVEEIESEHAANVLDLQKKTQARAIRIDEVAEKAKLGTLQQRLSLALLQQTEFTDKTKESTRVGKENQIAMLQSQVGEQTTLLDDYYAGRLVTQGMNISTQLEAENVRYAEELRLAGEQQALQEEQMQQSLGRQAIQQFEAWATMRGIPAEEMLKMKNQIATDYGLMTEEGRVAADLQIDIWEDWATDMNQSTASVTRKMATVSTQAASMTTSLNLIPREINITITTTEQRRTVEGGIARREDQGGREGAAGPRMQGGGNFTVPNRPEFENDGFKMNVSAGERVIVVPRDQNTTNNFTLNSTSAASQASVDQSFQMMVDMAA